MKKIVICGSRDFNDYNLLCDKLQHLLNEKVTILCGHARGADTLGEKWAKENNKQLIYYPADWAKHNKGAGIIRNRDMARDCDEIIAFWDRSSKGTKHIINFGTEIGKPVEVVYV